MVIRWVKGQIYAVEPDIFDVLGLVCIRKSFRTRSAPEPEVKMPEKVVFLLGRAIDASLNSEDKWMAAVIEAVMEFKLAAFENVTLVSPDLVRRHVPDHSISPEYPTIPIISMLQKH